MSTENKKRLGALLVAFVGTFAALYAYNEFQSRKEAKAIEEAAASVEA